MLYHSKRERVKKIRGTLKEKATFPNLQGNYYGLGKKCPKGQVCLDTGFTAGGTIWGSYGSLRKGELVRRNGPGAEGRALVLTASDLQECEQQALHVPVLWPQTRPLCTPYDPPGGR